MPLKKRTYMKKFITMVMVLCLFVGAMPGQMYAAQGKKSKKLTLRVMSFNIRMSANATYDGINAWPNRKNAVLKMLRTENPDMFGVQEMLPDQQQFLRDSLSNVYDMVGVGRDDGKTEGECMGIFFKKERFQLLEYRTLWLSETPDQVSQGWDGACKRTCTMALLKDRATGLSFYYLNTHLDHVGKMARREGVMLLKNLVDSLCTRGYEVILGGDMNTSSDDAIFVPLTGKEGNMRSAREIATQTDHKLTFTGYNKEPHTCIDHLFVTKGFEVLRFKTVDQDYGVPFVSDHYPIVMEVQK